MARTKAGAHTDSGSATPIHADPAPVVPFPTLRRILGCPATVPPETVWTAFLDRFGPLILKTATVAQRGRGPPDRRRDAAMDAYTRVLEDLRRDEFRRLRAFPGADEEALVRWLVVVSRRICTDLWRERYGRTRSSVSTLQRTLRRRLADELWETTPTTELPSERTDGPEWTLRRNELRSALTAALDGMEPRDRLLLTLRFQDELPARKVASLLGLPTPFHVYRRVNKLLARLRSELEARGIEGPHP